MASDEMIAVTGATGALGGRVAALLAGRDVPMRLVVRDPGRAPDIPQAEVAIAAGYHDGDAMAAAFRGCGTVFLVSGRESATRVQEHQSAVDAAVAAGVERIVYTSFLSATPDAVFTLARHHHATEQHIRASGLAWTFLRDSMYLDFVPFMASAEGVIAGPGGDGRCSFVARDDVAEAAVAVLRDPAAHAGQAYGVTGPEALSFAECAAVLTAMTGREVRYHDETEEEAYASRASYGAPDFEVEGWVTSYQAVAAGELSTVTDVVPRLTGHRAMDLEGLLRAHPETWAHLRS